MYKKVLCLTEVSHLPEVLNILESIGTIYENSNNKSIIKNTILSTCPISLFVNPNNMTYKIDESLLKNSSVKIIVTASTGTNHIDVEYCQNNNIKIISLKEDYKTIEKITSTAELAFALMLSMVRKLPDCFKHVKNGKWNCYELLGRQLNSLTVGIVGFGRLGNMFARFCNAFGMNILINDKYKNSISFPNVSLNELFNKSNVISIHVHLNEETYHFIDKYVLSESKDAFLINTSRGSVVCESDIIEALEKGYLAGYATDVLEDELGNIEKSEIIKRMSDLNIITTPHVGGSTIDAQKIAYKKVIEDLKILLG